MSNDLENKSEVKSESKLASWWKATSQYLHEVWVEVRPNNGRVTWPTYDSVKVSTKVVIVSSVFLGLFIGLLDVIFSEIYTAIINSGGAGIG